VCLKASGMGSVACRACGSSDDEAPAGSKDVVVGTERQSIPGFGPQAADCRAAASAAVEKVTLKDDPPSSETFSSVQAEIQSAGPRLPAEVLESHTEAPASVLPEAVHGIVNGVSEANDGPIEAQAWALLKGLRACEAALLLDGSSASMSAESSGLRSLLDMQLRMLGDALETLGDHPGLSTLVAKKEAHPEVLMGISVPSSPSSAQSAKSARTSRSEKSPRKRDVLEINFDLDEHGRRVEAVVEFCPDGGASLMWTAFDLPVPLPYVLCMVQEVDLLGDIAPYVKDAGVLHQFSSNEADRLVRVISQPPIPMVSGLEAVSQRFGYDLLDTPWEAFCLVEVGPDWSSGSQASLTPSSAQKSPKTAGNPLEQWRGVSRPPPYQKGLKQVDVKKVVALGCPAGPTGQCTTILFSGAGDLKVPRGLLPNWLISWLVKLIGKFIYQRALDRVDKFDSSAHGARLRASDFYPELYRRIEEHVAAKVKRAEHC